MIDVIEIKKIISRLRRQRRQYEISQKSFTKNDEYAAFYRGKVEAVNAVIDALVLFTI